MTPAEQEQADLAAARYAIGATQMRRKDRSYRPMCPTLLAARWESWCGSTAWSQALMEFAELGGMVVDWGGMPQSRSAIPLTFELFLPNGIKFPSRYRLKDIRAAVALAREMRREECPQ